MALNGTEREDNFCHKSAVMWMLCDLPPVVETGLPGGHAVPTGVPCPWGPLGSCSGQCPRVGLTSGHLRCNRSGLELELLSAAYHI